MNQTQLNNYADLILWCVEDVADQNVFISSETIHRDLAVTVVERAYQAGARQAMITYEEPAQTASRIRHASREHLTVFPSHMSARVEELVEDESTYIRIAGQREPEILAELDAERIGHYMSAYRKIVDPLRQQVSRFEKAWVGVLMTTPALARKAFPDCSPEEAFARYEQAIVDVLGLDDDPVSRWKALFADLIERQNRLNALRLDKLIFTGPGTNLEIGLHPDGRFMAAEETLPNGRTVRVNMPSCEVFSTPDARRTNGRVKTTRPFQSTSAPGQTVHGAWFEFADGAVVDFGADSGKEIVAQVLEMDERARYLGEVALVDIDSPVSRQKITFGHMLYDENAACHIALGSGFPRIVEGAAELDREKQVERGVNQSLVHDDMMIGSESVDVTGVKEDGSEIPVMREGRFVV